MNFTYYYENVSPSEQMREGHTHTLGHLPWAHWGQPADQKLKFCSCQMVRVRTEAQCKTRWASINTAWSLYAHECQAFNPS